MKPREGILFQTNNGSSNPRPTKIRTKGTPPRRSGIPARISQLRPRMTSLLATRAATLFTRRGATLLKLREVRRRMAPTGAQTGWQR
jgi:hypothetical protein